MNKLIIISLLTFLIFLNLNAQDTRPQISVNAEAELKVSPDRARISLNIETDDKDISIAKNKNAKILNQLSESLKKLEIGKDDFQTTHFSAHPRYKHSKSSISSDGRVFLGYFVNNRIELQIHDLKKLDAVISSLFKSEVCRINSINFSSSKQADYKEEARNKALLKAQTKASKMCQTLKQKLGAPLLINEGNTPRHYPQARAMSLQRNFKGQNNGPSIAIGKISIKAKVSVTFAMQPAQ